MKAGEECVDRHGDMRCKDHPKYRAMGGRKPENACERCWQMFFGIPDLCINCGCQANEDGGEA